MGWLFKTPSDDATESTLRAIHMANTLDTAYERTWGWVKTVIFSFISALSISAFEYHNDWSFWEHTVNWLANEVMGWFE